MLFFFNISYAQRYEIGLFAGGNNIIGDIGNDFYVAPNSITVGGLFKWNKNERLALRGDVYFSIARGVLSKSPYPFDGSKVGGYNKGIANSEFVFEWNLLPYNLRKDGANTPYMYAGLGVLVYQGREGYDYNGNIDYDPHASQLVFPFLNFETTISLPFGVGYKYALNHQWVLAADLGFRYAFSDNLDNSAVRKVGNLNSNDWFTTLGLTLTYVFGRDPCPCGQ